MSITVVFGLGITGVSVIRHLVAEKKSFWVVDTRDDPPNLAWTKSQPGCLNVLLGSYDAGLIDLAVGQDAINWVVSPGLDLKLPFFEQAASKGMLLKSDVQVFLEFRGQMQAAPPMIAVTGSNGKSTVVDALAYLLKGFGFEVGLAGNIGTGVLDLLHDGCSYDYLVLELSSFQLERLPSMKASIACFLNLSSDHLDRHGTMRCYAEAKQRIFNGSDCLVFCADDEATWPVSINQQPANQDVDVATFGFAPNADWQVKVGGNKSFISSHQYEFSASQLKLEGLFQYLNIAAILAMVEALELDCAKAFQLLCDYRGLAHRCQWVTQIDGVDYYNDSKATNTGAALAAVQHFSAMKKDMVVIAGGDAKGADMKGFADALNDHAQAVILLGKDARLIAQHLNPGFYHFVESIQDAVIKSRRIDLPKGGVVLLAPACASIDMFENYQVRGDAFSKACLALQEGEA